MLWASAMKPGCHFHPKPLSKPTTGWRLVVIPRAGAVSAPQCLASPFGAFQRTEGKPKKTKKEKTPT